MRRWLIALMFLASDAALSSTVWISSSGGQPGWVSVLDEATGALVATVPVGIRPTAVVVSPRGDEAFVISGGASASTLSIISVASRQVVADVALGDQTRGLAVSPNGDRVYAASVSPPALYAVDVAARHATKVTLTRPAESLAVSRDGASVFVASGERVLQVDVAQASIVGTFPRAGQFDGIVRHVVTHPDGTMLFATVQRDGGFDVLSIDIATGKVLASAAAFPVASAGMAVANAGDRIYVGAVGRLFELDAATLLRLRELDLGALVVGIALTRDDSHAWITRSDGKTSRIDLARFVEVFTTPEVRGAGSLADFVAPPEPAPGTLPVEEYFHAGLRHYFVTADPAEIALLDRGAIAGWARTGQRFAAHPAGSAQASPVCRFYGLPEAGLDSHFYSASAAECRDVEARFGTHWRKESDEVFRVSLPDPDGRCAAGQQPVYRVWNGRADSNHRYVTLRALRDRLVAAGYVAEGYGDGVALCAPPMR